MSFRTVQTVPSNVRVFENRRVGHNRSLTEASRQRHDLVRRLQRDCSAAVGPPCFASALETALRQGGTGLCRCGVTSVPSSGQLSSQRNRSFLLNRRWTPSREKSTAPGADRLRLGSLDRSPPRQQRRQVSRLLGCTKPIDLPQRVATVWADLTVVERQAVAVVTIGNYRQVRHLFAANFPRPQHVPKR